MTQLEKYVCSLLTSGLTPSGAEKVLSPLYARLWLTLPIKKIILGCINIATNNQSKIDLPYGDSQITITLPASKQVDIYLPNDLPPVADGLAEICRAMANPIDSQPLREIARGKHTASIIIDDATRSVPTPLILRSILNELEHAGLPANNVTVVVATGLHRALTQAENQQLTGGLGLKVISHDAHNPNELVPIGTTSGGCKLLVNRTVAQSELRIVTGDIELHQFAGYGGGAKSVMPGTTDAASVNYTHSMMEAKGAGPGNFHANPIRAEIEESADMLGVHFMVNVVLNSRHKIVKAFAGDVHTAFLAGINLVDQMYKVHLPHQYDLALASAGGYPRDINLYQSQKAIRSARRTVKKNGQVIVFAECRQGHGSQLAYDWAQEATCPQDLVDRHRKEFIMGGHKAYQLACEVLWADIYIYSMMSPEMVSTFFLKPLKDPALPEDMLTDVESIAVFPQATHTLPILPGQTQVSF